jgi:hypothetical protein
VAEEELAVETPKALKDFADWAKGWQAGDKAKADAIIAKMKEVALTSPNHSESSKSQAIVESSGESNKIVLHPCTIEIATTAPIDTLTEMQSLYHISKNVLATLIVEWADKGKVPHQLATWMKEARTLVIEIHKMTAGFQDKVTLKKMDFVAAAISQNSELSEQFKLTMIKELEQMELLKRKPKMVKL